MCVTPGAQVKTSKKYVLLIGLFGAAVWLLPLVLSAIELKAYTDGERIKTIYNQQVPHFLTRDYAIAGVALSGIYILPSLLMILGVLTESNTLIIPWLVIAMIYMTGFTLMTAGVFQPVMHFWNVVLSYVRKNKSENNETQNRNDIELGERLAPDPAVHAQIYKQKSNSNQIQTKKPTHPGNPGKHNISQKSNARSSQQQRAYRNTPTHYYQTPTDQKNYHML